MKSKLLTRRRDFLGSLAGAAMAPALACSSMTRRARARRDRPNIVFIITDQQQAAAWSAAGNPALRTPAMDSVASGGVRFAQTFCATPQCSASRAAMVTGRYPHSAGVITNIGAIGSRKLDPQMPSVGRVFRNAGYETAWFGKWHLGDDPTHYGFTHFDHAGRGVGELVASAAVQFLKQRHDRPFIMFASFLNPHDIYKFKKIRKEIARGRRGVVLPKSLHDDLSKKPRCQARFLAEDQGTAVRGFGDEQWRRYLEVYYYLTEKVDGRIGEVLDALDGQGLEKETIVVFTSDHGDLGGAHGMPFKGPCMYRELVEIPLAIRWPGVIRAGQVRHEFVSNVDYLPTLCDLAGIEPPTGMEGRSLRPLLEGERDVRWRDFVISEYYSKQRWANPIRMLRTDRWKYVRYRRWGEELYDLENDPDELDNLAFARPLSGKPRQVRDELAGRLDRWMRETKDNFAQLEPTDRKGRPLPK